MNSTGTSTQYEQGYAMGVKAHNEAPDYARQLVEIYTQVSNPTDLERGIAAGAFLGV